MDKNQQNVLLEVKIAQIRREKRYFRTRNTDDLTTVRFLTVVYILGTEWTGNLHEKKPGSLF